MDFPAHPDDPNAVSVSRIHYPAGEYPHPPTGLFQLRVVRTGSSYAQIDLGAGVRQVFTRPGDILVSLGDRPSYFRIEEGRDLTFVQAGPQIVAQVLSMLSASPADLVPIADRPFRDPLIADLAVRMEDMGQQLIIARQWTFGVLISLTLEAARRQMAKRHASVLTPKRLAAIQALINDNLERTISVRELADVAGLAERAFSAAFREATSLPVYQYVLRQRVERAVELLQTGNLSLAEVAQQSGFSHQAHMTRMIKKLKGQTPAKIRAQSLN